MTERLLTKPPIEFAERSEWADPVRETSPREDAGYQNAFARTILFVRFYEVRNRPFPRKFCTELATIVALAEPGRTRALEVLNRRIFADMTHFLLAAVQQESDRAATRGVDPEPGTDELIAFLLHQNPYFAMWTRFSEYHDGRPGARSWEVFLAETQLASPHIDIEFAQLMSQLGKLLHQYRTHRLALPPHLFSRVWFLHYLHGAERIVQTRAVVQELTEAIQPCAFA
jgi:hypothetical protein